MKYMTCWAWKRLNLTEISVFVSLEYFLLPNSLRVKRLRVHHLSPVDNCVQQKLVLGSETSEANFITGNELAKMNEDYCCFFWMYFLLLRDFPFQIFFLYCSWCCAVLRP